MIPILFYYIIASIILVISIFIYYCKKPQSESESEEIVNIIEEELTSTIETDSINFSNAKNIIESHFKNNQIE